MSTSSGSVQGPTEIARGEYLQRVAQGEGVCFLCRAWQPRRLRGAQPVSMDSTTPGDHETGGPKCSRCGAQAVCSVKKAAEENWLRVEGGVPT